MGTDTDGYTGHGLSRRRVVLTVREGWILPIAHQPPSPRLMVFGREGACIIRRGARLLFPLRNQSMDERGGNELLSNTHAVPHQPFLFATVAREEDARDGGGVWRH
jgi:hypothetical protein